MKSNPHKRNISVEDLGDLKDDGEIEQLLKDVVSKEDKTRFEGFGRLLSLSEESPEKLYGRWDYFAGLLESDNVYHRYIAICLLANLARKDTENKFERIFERFYGLMDDASLIPTSHLALNSGKIARAKPALELEITDRLLGIDRTHHKQKELIKAYIIDGFNDYYDVAKDKGRILAFVEKQLESESLKTRRKAKEFLKKWEERSSVCRKKLRSTE